MERSEDYMAKHFSEVKRELEQSDGMEQPDSRVEKEMTQFIFLKP